MSETQQESPTNTSQAIDQMHMRGLAQELVDQVIGAALAINREPEAVLENAEEELLQDQQDARVDRTLCGG